MAHLTGEARAAYVRAMFSQITGRYDLMNTLMTAGLDAAWRRTTVRLAAPNSGGLGLDVACGAGSLTRELARSPLRRVVGVDFTPAMLAEAKRHRDKAARPIDWVNADALALPFPDNTFDCVTIGFGLRNFGDIDRGLAEMRRVTKPGGRLACLECSPLRDTQVHRLIRLYFHGVVPILGGLVGGSREAYQYLPTSTDHFPNASTLAARLRAVGWADVRWRAVGLGVILIHHAAKPRAYPY